MKQAVKKSKKSDNIDERIFNVNNYFTSTLYKELETMLEEKHMLAAYFAVSIEIASQMVR